MHKTRFQGFTLIELLVVIAIIGILSAVVLASLSTARLKGQDASIQSNLSTIQTQAEIYYGNAGNQYHPSTLAWASGACANAGLFSDATIRNAMLGAYSAAGSTATNMYCAASTTGYIVAVKLTSTSTAYWCVDSGGVAKIVMGAASIPATMPAGGLCP